MYGLILAGGSGSRLWPLSRELYPKQLLNIQNTESLLQATFERISECLPASNIISMTGVKHFSNVKYQLSSIYEKAETAFLSGCINNSNIESTSVIFSTNDNRGITKDDLVSLTVFPYLNFVVLRKFIP